jgi:hypothetical protein
MSEVVISIDPSGNTCGLGLFVDKKLIGYALVTPDREVQAMDFLIKAKDIVNQIAQVYLQYDKPENKIDVVMEIPEHVSSMAGFMARESGNLNKLCFVCGMIYDRFPVVVTYTPMKWKGQLTKEQVRNRLSLTYPQVKGMDHNIVEGIGIGHRHIFGRV